VSARFRVRFSHAAAGDLVALSEYLAERSPVAARRVVNRLRGRVRSLRSHPQRGRAIPELADTGLTSFRELVDSPYRILYRIAEKEVLVLAVLDGRRDLEDLLLERLLRG
jgi:plasmid stabilization system protein ParE